MIGHEQEPGSHRDHERPSRSWLYKLADTALMVWANRNDLAGGLLLIAAGLAMIAFLFSVALLPAKDPFTVVSLFVVVEGWSIVATVLLTLGLRQMLGPNSRLDRYLERSWWRVLVFVLGSSLVVAAGWLAAVL